MNRIAIIGPGAIGGTVAAWLAQNPAHDVFVAARTPFEKLEVETPGGRLEATPHVLTKLAQAEAVDWVLIATKTYDAQATARWLVGLRGPETIVAVLQNGVEHVERFEPYVPRDVLLPVVVECSAAKEAPGRIQQRSSGRLIVPQTDAGHRFTHLFADSGLDVTEQVDFKSALWTKLCFNAPGALAAAVLAPTGLLCRHVGIAGIMTHLVEECVRVGRAEGAALDDAIAKRVIDQFRDAPLFAVNSIHADRLAGRPMEIDARNGVIVRLGRKHRIPTPLNALVVALLEAVSKQ